MKNKNLKGALLLVLVLVCSSVFGQKLVLKTDLSTHKFAEKEKINLSLVIEGVDGKEMIQKEGFSLISKDQFVYKFSITPEKKGALVLGPYELEFNGKKLVSNILKLKIRPRLKANEIKIHWPDEVSQNKKVMVELIGTKEALKNVKVAESNEYTCKVAGSSSEMKYVNGEMKAKYTTRFYFVFKKAGKYVIDKSWFIGIPDYLSIRSEEIKVN